VDPTAAVSPARIEEGIAAAVPQSDPLPLTVRADFALFKRLRLTLDAATNSWNQWVLGYTPDRQRRLFTQVGMGTPSWGDLVVMMLVVSGVIVLGIAILTLRRLWATESDAVQRVYRAFARKLARRGFVREPAEGPLAFAQRVSQGAPELASAVEQVTQIYLGLRYGGVPLAHLKPAEGHHAPGGGRNCSGSTGLPSRRISKCSRTRSASVLPISAIRWPPLTRSPSFTSSARLCA
jgi:hypothetical protein